MSGLEMETTAEEYKFLLGGDKQVLKWIVVMTTQLYKYTTQH